MSIDPQPLPAEVTDPGFKQSNRKVGVNGEFTLPDVVQIVHPLHTSKVGILTQEVWVRANWLARGLAGTMVQWFAFFAEVGKAYPFIAVACLAFGTAYMDEKFADQPILSNLFRYALTSYDPDAAEKIFAEKQVERDPIGKAAKKAVEAAAAEFVESPEYRELQDELAQYAAMQSRRQAYVAAGMVEDVKAVDEEIAVARAERRAAREKKAAERVEAVTVEEVVAEVPHAAPPAVDEHQQGEGMPAHEEEGLDPEPVPAAEEVTVEPAEDVQPEKQGKAERRRKKSDLPFELPLLPQP